jgi:hypothetical protein
MATKHPLDGTEPSSSVSGRSPALKPEHIAVLHDIVTLRAQASLQEIADELHHRCGLRGCAATIRRALLAQGIIRLKAVCKVYAGRAEGAKRYGYTAAHRREDVAPYSTNLIDAEWELVAHLFERVPGQRGTPVHYSRRDPVNASTCCARTAPGDFYPIHSHRGKLSTKHFRVGLTPAYLSKCKTGCVSNGVHGWDARAHQARR